MILLDAIDWLVTAILWFFAPAFRLFGLYAVICAAAVVLVFAAVSALRWAGKRRRARPT